MKQLDAFTLKQLRGYARQRRHEIIVVSPLEFTMLCDTLSSAQEAVKKFENAVVGTIGGGVSVTQVKFTPR